MAFNAVLFDLYGTLADIEVDERDPQAWAALRAFLQIRARNLRPEYLRDRFLTLCSEEMQTKEEGFVLENAFRRLLMETGGTGSDREIIEFAKAFRSVTTKNLRARPYAIPVLRMLRTSGICLGIVS